MHFKYAPPLAGAFSGMPLVTTTLSRADQEVTVDALVDSGATISILPYELGAQLGLVWDDWKSYPVYVSGAFSGVPDQPETLKIADGRRGYQFIFTPKQKTFDNNENLAFFSTDHLPNNHNQPTREKRSKNVLSTA